MKLPHAVALLFLAAGCQAPPQRPDIVIRDVNVEMEAYRLYTVVPRLVAFIDDLTNWYVRRSRARFWKSEDDRDKGKEKIQDLLKSYEGKIDGLADGVLRR